MGNFFLLSLALVLFIALCYGQETQVINICSLKSETGNCKARMTRYFYNEKTTHCEQFTYGGCGGNQNNFETIFECRKTCGQTMPANTIGVGVPVL